MKKITLLSAFLLLFAWGSHSQCIRTALYPDSTIESNNLGLPQEIDDYIYTENNYSQLSNLIVGGNYLFTCSLSSSGEDKYITVTDWDNNVMVHGESPLTVENITSSQIRLHYSNNDACGGNESPHTATITALLECSPPINLLVSGITTSNASFTWEPQGEETAWEVLVLEADLPAPTGATSGTAVSTTPAYTTAILEAAKEYSFYIRANCGTEFSPWNKLNFASGCDPINLFIENFDTTDEGDLPICWSAIISGEDVSENAYIQTVDYNFVSESNAVEIYNSDSGTDSNITLVSPNIANLGAGTHRLKFFARSYGQASLEVGTLDEATPSGNFTLMEDVTVTGSYAEYVVDFTGYSGTDTFIAFRHNAETYISFFLDDIRWEVAPLCPDVTEIAVTTTTINSASFSWNPGGEETSWDIVYGADSVTDPNTLTPISPAPTETSEATVSELAPATDYKVWVRSKCGTPNGDGAWIGPVNFTTPCLPTTLFNENFDTTDYGDLPECWSSIIRGTEVTQYDRVYTNDGGGHSEPNSVRLQRDFLSTEVILVSPNLSTLAAGTHRLKFYAFGYDASIEIGTLSSSTNQAEFSMLEEVEITEEYTEYAIDFTVYTGTDTFIGIKLNDGYSVSLDDIRWEVAPLCPDVTDIQVTALTTTTADLLWTPGGEETAWDVVYGEASITDPSALTPIAPAPTGTSEAALSGLEPGTTYNIWVRSKCGAPNGDGAWIGPKTFSTSCLPVATFNENFDTTDFGTLPACWSSIIRGEDTPSNADIYTTDNPYSEPNSVVIGVYNESGTGDSDVILVSPNLSTLTTGTHRLKFFGHGYSTTLEIGTLDSASQNAVFTSWDEIEISDEFTEYIVDFTGYDGTDTFIGIRHKMGDWAFLDDIRWELAPLCSDVQNISMSDITSESATVTWEPGGSETNWQIVRGGIEVTDPSTLIPSGLLTETTFTFNELTENTVYNVWVRSACGAPNGDGAWIGPKQLTTQCLATGLPFIQDFESAVTPAMPSCTTLQNLSSANSFITNNPEAYGFNSNVLQYSYNCSSSEAANAWYFTNGLTLTAGTEYTISYKYGGNTSSDDDYVEKLKVMYGTGADADGMMEELADHTFSTDTPTTNEATFVPETSGVYYFGFNAYSDSCQNNIYIDDITIQDVLKTGDFNASDFKFYPNPVKDVLNLSYTENISDVVVFNLLGQKVIENTINATSTQLDMSGLASGSYLVKVMANNQTKTIKVIKE